MPDAFRYFPSEDPLRRLLLSILLLSGCIAAAAQSQPAEQPAGDKIPADVITYTDGEKLKGSLRSAHYGTLTFSTLKAGEASVQPSDLESYRSDDVYVIFRKGTKVTLTSGIVGKVEIHGADVTVQPVAGEPVVVKADDIELLMPNDEFTRELAKHRPFYRDWEATLGAGFALARSTENSISLNAEVSAERREPAISFLPDRNRTLLSLTDSFDRVSAPGLDTESQDLRETHTLHASAERDEYISKRFFLLAVYTFDRDHSQGLLGQASYGAGLGWTAYSHNSDEIQIKTNLDRKTQDYLDNQLDTHLIGEKISQTLQKDLPRNLRFTESLDLDVPFTSIKALSGRGEAELRIPVLHNLDLVLSGTDNYLNSPTPGTSRHSYRMATRITYTFR